MPWRIRNRTTPTTSSFYCGNSKLHRDVQDGPFRQSLPENRQKLFSLLQMMEKSGGWPYIPRLQLRTFIDLLGQDSLGMAA